MAARKKTKGRSKAKGREVGPNDDFGTKVRNHAREHDVVYKVK
jgi:hypothetical protein